MTYEIINFKTIKIEEIMRIDNLTSDNIINLDIINSKDFVLWMKQQIKSLVASQKIAKRDRKNSRHPCPEKRVYSPSDALMKVDINRRVLRTYYIIYHILRHRRSFAWDKITMIRNGSGWTTPSGVLNEFWNEALAFDSGFACDWYSVVNILGELADNFVKDVKERSQKALCHC